MGRVRVALPIRSVMKKLMVPFLLVFVLGVFFVSGCDLAQPLNKGEPEQPAAWNDEPPENAPPAEIPQVEVNTVEIKADVGMSGKGNYGPPVGNPMEIITVPISAMFRTRDRLVLQQIAHAMNLYNGIHERIPASHEEFMDDIIRANNIRLPQLPHNQEYIYDPKDGELKISKPKDVP